MKWFNPFMYVKVIEYYDLRLNFLKTFVIGFRKISKVLRYFCASLDREQIRKFKRFIRIAEPFFFNLPPPPNQINTGIFSDSKNIFVASVDVQNKLNLQNFNWFHFYVYKLCIIMCISLLHMLQYWIDYHIR